MLVVSCQPCALMGRSTDIRHMIVNQGLGYIRPTMYFPELNSSRMCEHSDLPHRKMLISNRLIPN